MTAGIKLAVGAFIIGGATVYMAFVGAASSWKYYVTADECLANAEQFAGRRVRVSGSIVPGSLQVSAERNRATFGLQGQSGRLEVVCEGPLPDNLAEAMEVVVEGHCEPDGSIYGDKVLTRCASKYESGPADGSAPEANSVANQQGRKRA